MRLSVFLLCLDVSSNCVSSLAANVQTFGTDPTFAVTALRRPRFRDFTLGGGQYAYRVQGAPPLNAASHAALGSKDVAKTKEMPRVNTRPAWQTGKATTRIA